jgi:hypothetical protein
MEFPLNSFPDQGKQAVMAARVAARKSTPRLASFALAVFLRGFDFGRIFMERGPSANDYRKAGTEVLNFRANAMARPASIPALRVPAVRRAADGSDAVPVGWEDFPGE